jgi:hypothetical protein
MRRVSIFALALLALIGCDQAAPKQPETPTTEPVNEPVNEPTPQISEQTFLFDKTVTWAAYQKDGVWQRLELNKDADTVLTLAVERGAFTYLCDQLDDEFNSFMRQSIFYFESAALEQELLDNSLEELPPFYCTYTGEIPTQPTAKIRGTIAGLNETDNYHVAFRNDDYSIFAFQGFPRDPAYDYETVGGAHAGTYDAIAIISPEGSSMPSKAVIDPKAVAVADKDVIYDFDLSEAVNLDTYTFTWNSLKTVESVWSFVDMNGLGMGGNLEGSKETTINYAGFPAGYVTNPSYTIHSQATADGCFYSFTAQLQTPRNLQTNPLPCADLKFEPASDTSPLNLSWTYTAAFQPDMLGISFEQGRSLNDFFEGSGYSVDVSFIGSHENLTSYTLEDFSALPGWQSTWSLKNEATLYNLYYADLEISNTERLQTSVSLQGRHEP